MIMKKSLFLSAALLLSASAAVAQQADEVIVKGNLQNAGDTLIVLEPRETLVVKDGKFQTTLKGVKVGQQLLLATPGTLSGTERKFTSLQLVPGTTVELTGDLAASTVKLGGDKFYTQYESIRSAITDATKAETEQGRALVQQYQSAADDAAKKDIEQQFNALQQTIFTKTSDVLRAHASEDAAALFAAQADSEEQLNQLVALLTPEVRNGKFKTYIDDIFARLEEAKKQEEAAAAAQAAGVEAPNFTLKDIKGNDFALASLRGKYVVLDFWGSWCVWCIKGIPEMKEYYTKYAGKFEILGIDCGDTEAKWKEAVEKHELPWLHVINGTGENDVTKLFAISGFPTKIVLGPDGKIVKTIVGESPDFYTLLDELFSK
jgi:thiol-disulfide isomerase/thioredoxin